MPNQKAQAAHDIVRSQGGSFAGANWDESRHPRQPAGTSTGGEFTSATRVGQQIVEKIADSGIGSDHVHSLYSDDPEGAIAEGLDSVKTSDVLSYGEAIGKGTFAEEEIIVPRHVLKGLG